MSGEGAVPAPDGVNAVNVEQAVPFFWVRDMAASLRFYVDGLGFQITQRWEDGGAGKIRWCWLRLGGAAAMLQESRSDGHHHPPAAPGAGVAIYFICKDALAIHRDVTARGVSAKQPFVGNGMWVVELADPDGHAVLFESPTDAPETEG
jgi:lactoylglutathione lyase